MIAIVTGMIASYPVGGVLWDYGQYALGLERMGFDVFYLEDTGWQTYDPRVGAYGEDPTYGVEFLKTSLAELSPTLGRRWRFRGMNGQSYGLSDADFAGVLRSADLFLNVSGGTLLRDEYLPCRRKVLIDSDPGWNHFRNFPRWDANPNWQGSHGYRAHDYFFTYAERMGRPDCALPDFGLNWQVTRPPVVMDCWGRTGRWSVVETSAAGQAKWTTVMTWKNFQETIRWNGSTYGTKELEFGKVEELPLLTKAALEIAAGGDQAPRQAWRKLGWSVVDSQSVSRTPEAYRDYVRHSRGEFSVAKNVYVATRCGWFSCRSVCYLAASLPVVVQDTGFSELIPTGKGLLAFSDLEGAVAALDNVERDYEEHRRAAAALAREYFSSEVVLGDLLRRVAL